MMPNDRSLHGEAPTTDDVAPIAVGEATSTTLGIRIGPDVVYLSGELDIDSAPGLTAALRALDRPGGTIELDLTELTFIDSSGIRVLCHGAARLGPQGRLLVSHPTTAVRRALELTGLDYLIDTGDDRSMAIGPS